SQRIETEDATHLLAQLNDRFIALLKEAKSNGSFGELTIVGSIVGGDLRRVQVGFSESLVIRPEPGNNPANN
ncbi:hypothetical protein GYB59_02055, partial [bacterium]|nr:hypothetical protein [bacterium]